jgi:hypothetical protein
MQIVPFTTAYNRNVRAVLLGFVNTMTSPSIRFSVAGFETMHDLFAQ